MKRKAFDLVRAKNAGVKPGGFVVEQCHYSPLGCGSQSDFGHVHPDPLKPGLAVAFL